MPEAWTGKLVGKMHVHKISYSDLGKEIGITAQYVALILNGLRNPSGMREKMECAVNDIINRRAVSKWTR